MSPALLLLPLLAFSPPPPAEHFPAAKRPDHFFLVVNAGDLRVLRQDDARACAEEAQPPGNAMQLLVALAGLESEAFDRDYRVPCDSLCWADGHHGESNVTDALALGCDSYFRDVRRLVDTGAVIATAGRAGFGKAPPGEASGTLPEAARLTGPDGLTDSGCRVTAWQWIRFWRELTEGRLCRSSETASLLLHACGRAVHGPRGHAGSLNQPRRLVRALLGESAAGAWATGTLTSPESFPWFFALFVRGGNSALAAARADRLLEETLRTVRHSTAIRGGEPLPTLPPAEDRLLLDDPAGR